MNMPSNFDTNQKIMSSKILLEIINFARLNFNENPVRLNDFNNRIADELEGEYYETFVVQNTNNTESIVYGLTIDQCMLIGMRESKAVRKNVLATLKQKQPPLLPQSFSEALQLAADQARLLELAAPKVTYYDTVVERSTLLNASQVAQKIQMSAVKMNRILESLNVYHRGVKRARLFQQWFIDKGFGEVKQTELGFSQPMFTTKGEAWIIEKLVSEGVIS
ncbi:DNA-binding protein [Acinetobacter baumannii]|uniref:phage antirepressor KilAC domain-containing protein n=1 Tax=Acinetobacter calcoaceticus/baumannii complex TaxID=909768 RepID=UPI000E6AC4B2|nr:MULTISPECIES: phage antirepressor KilAC domain-containing protein [Acinetobacter calcoaceticus/baumannii complex]QLF07804.1 DNA-binding protein [Acinetobacter baumannii]HEE6388435.1 phage antirepressor KilAC domain-containing protein [Acinetobacter baumannii]